MKNKKVFISGGAGVIGLELVKLLHEKGAIILVGDLQDRPNGFSEKIFYRKGDLNFITQEELDEFETSIKEKNLTEVADAFILVFHRITRVTVHIDTTYGFVTLLR